MQWFFSRELCGPGQNDPSTAAVSLVPSSGHAGQAPVETRTPISLVYSVASRIRHWWSSTWVDRGCSSGWRGRGSPCGTAGSGLSGCSHSVCWLLPGSPGARWCGTVQSTARRRRHSLAPSLMPSSSPLGLEQPRSSHFGGSQQSCRHRPTPRRGVWQIPTVLLRSGEPKQPEDWWVSWAALRNIAGSPLKRCLNQSSSAKGRSDSKRRPAANPTHKSKGLFALMSCTTAGERWAGSGARWCSPGSRWRRTCWRTSGRSRAGREDDWKARRCSGSSRSSEAGTAPEPTTQVVYRY